MPLTALKVSHAKPGRHADLHGLYLVVRENGTRSWMLRLQHRGQRRDFGLGPVRDVSLADARILASDYRKMVRSGLDPVRELGLRRKAVPSFETVARNCYEAMKGGWRDRRHASWLSSLENHVFPLIGKTPIDRVDSTIVLSVLEPVWTTIPDTARRITARDRRTQPVILFQPCGPASEMQEGAKGPATVSTMCGTICGIAIWPDRKNRRI